uniref:Uncharacterized protein n=1 Tax=Magallana gigas TaxID=29159 RepID=K1Q1A2_MAGGI
MAIIALAYLLDLFLEFEEDNLWTHLHLHETLLLIYRPGCASMYSWKEGLNHCDASDSTRQPTLEDVSTLRQDSWIYVARIFLTEISSSSIVIMKVNNSSDKGIKDSQTDFEPTVTACYQQDENDLPCFSLPEIHERKSHQVVSGTLYGERWPARL